VIRTSVVLAFALIVGDGLAFAAESLCPEPAPLPEGADDLRMSEEEFTLDHARSSVEFLRTEFAARIWGPDAVKDLNAWSGHYISYANSLKFIEGALLRQEALLQRLRAEELGAATPGSEEAREAEQATRDAAEKFCNLLESAEYVD
jgi:hypothetical protein